MTRRELIGLCPTFPDEYEDCPFDAPEAPGADTLSGMIERSREPTMKKSGEGLSLQKKALRPL